MRRPLRLRTGLPTGRHDPPLGDWPWSFGVGAVAGGASFVRLVLGYTFASNLRGYAYAPAFWLVVAPAAGPVIGWLLLGGVLIADGVRGLAVLAQTTSPVYWTVPAAVVTLLRSGGRAGSRPLA